MVTENRQFDNRDESKIIATPGNFGSPGLWWEDFQSKSFQSDTLAQTERFQFRKQWENQASFYLETLSLNVEISQQITLFLQFSNYHVPYIDGTKKTNFQSFSLTQVETFPRRPR